MILNRIRQASIGQDDAVSVGKQSVSMTFQEESKNSGGNQQQPKQTSKAMLGQTGRAPSLLGLLAAKRFTQNMKTMYGRTGSTYGSTAASSSIQITKKPSYRMEPKTKFNPDVVYDVIKSVVDQKMQGFKYHPKFCANISKLLSDDVKEQVKKLKYDRYKIVVIVHIGEKKGQCMMVASRCVLDKELDDFATYTMETPALYCSVSVFGTYNE
ncbi:hypothetical protein DPMN_030421 [Dreissena polymorpha]|uniref:Tctex1 domain-containing protein 2 n=1 Tax=Dreissena polymorpha TaxID=45954 RepID=A0A9D4LZX3_DREPO|nr:hypothetical protein DPMN_030421 [Dreissena polymorpha]